MRQVKLQVGGTRVSFTSYVTAVCKFLLKIVAAHVQKTKLKGEFGGKTYLSCKFVGEFFLSGLFEVLQY
jgi:hypothetical protein